MGPSDQVSEYVSKYDCRHVWQRYKCEGVGVNEYLLARCNLAWWVRVRVRVKVRIRVRVRG